MAVAAPKPELAEAPEAAPAPANWRTKWAIALGAVAGVMLLGWGAVYLMQDPGPTPAEEFRTALHLLDEGRLGRSREIAKRLEADDYRDPNFSGGTEFILGMVAFREADDQDETGREQRYTMAVSYLREAEQRALTDERRPEWAYALGVSLHRVGAVIDSRSLLEEAVQTYRPGRVEASLLLADIYLYLNEPETLNGALELNASVLETKQLSKSERGRALLQKVQVLLALGRGGEAEQTLAKVPNDGSPNPGTIVVRAQILMAQDTEQKYREAIELLKPIATDLGIERVYSRQASYLSGVCAQKLGDKDAAVHAFERTAEVYEHSHEALASDLRVGNVLRDMGRNEEALEVYGRALRTVRNPDQFRNKWISADEFRRVILEAWTAWVEKKLFAEAIALAELMTPLFPLPEAYEMSARAHERWAESLETEAAAATWEQRQDKQPELAQHWKQSGQAYARLASVLTATSAYPDALWQSAQHYLKGHDFEQAVEQLAKFIQTRPERLLPMALMLQGQAEMSLSRLDQALDNFRQVVKNHTTDPVVFETRYQIGICHLERGEPEAAEKAWRELIADPDLTPRAREWEHSLFQLGKLLYQKAERDHRLLRTADNEGRTEDAEQLRTAAFDRWTEVIGDLEQYLDRYPASPESREARYLLSKAEQGAAEILEHRLKTAETDNARADFRRRMEERLEIAIKQLTRLQSELKESDDVKQLDKFGQTLLQNCYFEIAHTQFKLRRYEQAITAYSSAATKYQSQTETLTAYVQMANCYQRLGKQAEARSMLEQAKVILKHIDDKEFKSPTTNLDRQEWERWLAWAMNLIQ